MLGELSPEVKAALAETGSVENEIKGFEKDLVAGEPKPDSEGVRDRLGAVVKGRLYRLLWWHGWGLKRLADLTSAFVRSQAAATKGLAAHIGDLSQSAADYRRLLADLEQRQRSLEAAQLKVQAQQIERNINQGSRDREEFAEVKHSYQALRDQVAQVTELTRAASNDRSEALAQQNAELAGHVGELARRVEQLTTDIATLNNQVNATGNQQLQQLAEQLSSLGLYTHQTRTALSLQDRRLSFFIEEARKRLPEEFSKDQLKTLVDTQTDHRYDSIYVAFEDIFRGSREEIKARQSIYLPYLQQHGAGSETMPILDLGCGRGEWLELLNDHSLTASGLDLNQIMIQHCRSLQLDVVEGDALAYLRTLPDASKGAITAFHLVEHLPFDLILALVDEALRVLKTGGVLILETPNPQNLMVGAHTFYLDPTHLKPLPGPMLRFFVEARGFVDANVWDLHPYPETVKFPENGSGVPKRLNDLLYGPQDYAVVARKA